jgi:glucans biosynthesis protein C
METSINKPERRYDIDWLRVLAIVTVFLFHCARFFNFEDWHVKNNQTSLGMSIFDSFIVLWIMPLFFILSGMSSYYSLNFRSGGQFFLSKVKRLIIPLIFGIFILVPPQVYIERISHSQFDGSFISFYPHYFDGFYGFGGNFAWMGLHLWYLLFLFIFSLLTLPLFLYLRKRQNFASKLASFFNKPATIFLPVMLLALLEALVSLQPNGIGIKAFGGWSLVLYLVFFIYGYFMANDPKFKLSMEKNRFISLVFGIILSILLITSWYSSHFHWIDKHLGYLLRTFSSWAWIITILGFGSKHLNFNNKILRYTNESVLPFYILHQSVIVTIGFYVAGWNIGIPLKYLIISTSSFAVIAILYELVIRRVNLFRFLFGMNVKVGQTASLLK